MTREWIKANVLVFKKGEKEYALNYKLVSLMRMIRKTLEKIMRMHMDDCFRRRNYPSSIGSEERGLVQQIF